MSILFESIAALARAEAESVRVNAERIHNLSLTSRRVGMLFALRQSADVVRAEIGKGSTINLESLAKRIELLENIPTEEIV